MEEGFPGDSAVNNSSAKARDAGFSPWVGKIPGGGNGSPLQYSYLENPTDRGAWRATQSMGLQRIGHNLAIK